MVDMWGSMVGHDGDLSYSDKTMHPPKYDYLFTFQTEKMGQGLIIRRAQLFAQQSLIMTARICSFA
jgi:hypothetical protein